MQPSEFCRRRLDALMAAFQRNPTAALVQEGVLLSSLVRLNPNRASYFTVLLGSLANDSTRPDLARAAREVLADWSVQHGAGETPRWARGRGRTLGDGQAA
ncbi:MAG: hypothetical protein HY690_16470 [Chloroflexi bacterium]|nr:hypothetical protein [Chloroflexota bacterium]